MQLGRAEAWYEYRISVRELVPGRGRGRRENNIKTDLRETGCGDKTDDRDHVK